MYLLENRTTVAFSAENPTGARNGGTRGKDCDKLNPCISLRPGEPVTIVDVAGSGVINHVWLGGYSNTHHFIIRMYWDNAEYPSVEAPISAFFGSAYDENDGDSDGRYPVLNSALILVAPTKGYNCYFEMPFRKHCRITIENRGPKEDNMFYMVTGWLGDLPENISYFHACYRQEHPVQKGRSYVVLDNIQGKGRYIGTTMSAGVNGHNTCWVEGETKMYIDGETYPSINYTGTEDYFCGSYAFGNDGPLHHYQPFCGQYVGMSAILGNTSEMYNAQKRFMLYRWHVKDAIYFDSSFKMVMDNLGWTGPRYDDYTTVAYYYLDKPSRLPFDLPSDQELTMR